MHLGLAGFASLSLPGLLRLKAANAREANDREPTAVIMVWKPGGCSHLDTYDPKPDIGSEYRGPFSTIATKIPGVRFTELLPIALAKETRAHRRVSSSPDEIIGLTLFPTFGRGAELKPVGSSERPTNEVKILSNELARPVISSPRFTITSVSMQPIRSSTISMDVPM